MRILILATVPPWASPDGVSIPVRELVRRLSQSHDLTVAYFARERPRDEAAADQVRLVELPRQSRRKVVSKSGVAAAAERIPFSVIPYVGAQAKLTVASLLRNNDFDGVVCHLVHTTALVPHSVAIRRCVIIQDVISHLMATSTHAQRGAARRVLRPLSVTMMRSYERRQYERFPVGSVVSKAEAERARTLAPHLDVRVIPNGVDTADYRPASDAPHDGGLLYLGSLRSGRNEDTAWRLSTEIFPRIRAVDPAARLDVVGWSPSARLLDYASSTPGVFVHGDADDIRPFLHRATVLLNPQPTGTGIKNSVLHALAMEVPCLVSPPVAEGIEGEDGRDYIVCGSDAEFADAALSLLADPKRARRIGEAGRRLVCDKYSWDSYAEGVVRMLTDGRGRSDG